jgi:pre-mRNA-processing factor SLU7
MFRMDLVFGQTERYVEYDESGKQIQRNKKKDTSKSKYLEDIYYGEHKSVWGSWWNEVLGRISSLIILGWGYECCHSNEKNSNCLGEKGKRLSLQKEYKIKKELEDDLRSKEVQLKKTETID